VPPPPPNWIRCDSNGDRWVDISDAVTVLLFLFTGHQGPACPASADCNGDGETDISDAIFELLFLFTDGRLPPPPYPGCEFFPGCGDRCP